MLARALPRQLDVGSDGPQPWLGPGVAGRSERPHRIHPRCRACDRRRTPSSRPSSVREFIPEVIQALLDCRASVSNLGHQGTSRRLNGSRSRLRRCASKPEPSTLRRHARAVETSRGFANLRLGNCYFIDDRCLSSVVVSSKASSSDWQYPIRALSRTLLEEVFHPSSTRRDGLVALATAQKSLNALTKILSWLFCGSKGCQRKKSPVQRRSRGGTRSGRR